MLSYCAFAEVWQKDAEVIQVARLEKLISTQTLIVKIRPEAKFKEQYYLGDFQKFFENRSGVWGYLTLSMIPDQYSAEEILKDLSKMPDILHAYFAPIPKSSDIHTGMKALKIKEERLNNETPFFFPLQFHLENPPRGLGAMNAWKIPGGAGKNVRIIDIEVCFEENHEDFSRAFYIGQNPKCEKNDHGTAVWGLLAAKQDSKGVVGIVPEAELGFYGFMEGLQNEVSDQYLTKMNDAIQGALQQLSEGDILLIEQQMIGPDYRRFTAVEYWPHIYEQLKEVTKKGIHCVEAAGNSRSNLDSSLYNRAFDLSKRDSGCVLVGAMGNNAEREKWIFSNYGSRVDAAGYGEDIVTTGYGDLFNGGNDRRYTGVFGGTSAAAPMVAGVMAQISSIAKEQAIVISPKEMRSALRATGSAQGVSTLSQRVGNLPDTMKLVEYFKLLQNE